MKCFVCLGSMNYYFTKQFSDFNLSNVDYWRCSDCGFVCSKTHLAMSSTEWSRLNQEYHSQYQGKDLNPDDKNWGERLIHQADALSLLNKYRVLSSHNPWLDFGCGDGKLSNILMKRYSLTLLNFDRYMNNCDYLNEDDLKNTSYDLVVNTSVFEHVLNLEPIIEMSELVSENGAFAIHTLVREDIPNDPDWFYLLPVHTAFFTNRSMKFLFEKLGYYSSIYFVEARMWFWLKKKGNDIAELVRIISSKENVEIVYSDSFVDYWKL